jgi:hypothetical protein
VEKNSGSVIGSAACETKCFFNMFQNYVGSSYGKFFCMQVFPSTLLFRALLFFMFTWCIKLRIILVAIPFFNQKNGEFGRHIYPTWQIGRDISKGGMQVKLTVWRRVHLISIVNPPPIRHQVDQEQGKATLRRQGEKVFALPWPGWS